MEWGHQQFFPCVVSSLMVVDGPWDPGLYLNLTQDTICDTWLFIQSLGHQPYLPGPNSPMSHSFPSFLVCFCISDYFMGRLIHTWSSRTQQLRLKPRVSGLKLDAHRELEQLCLPPFLLPFQPPSISSFFLLFFPFQLLHSSKKSTTTSTWQRCPQRCRDVTMHRL